MPLVGLSQTGSAAAREYALWSLALAVDASNCEIVVDAGGVEPLVRQLASQDKV